MNLDCYIASYQPDFYIFVIVLASFCLLHSVANLYVGFSYTSSQPAIGKLSLHVQQQMKSQITNPLRYIQFFGVDKDMHIHTFMYTY